MSAECHCREKLKTREMSARDWGECWQQRVEGGEGGLETKTKGARVRVGRVQRQGQQQWLPATGLPVNHSTLSLCHCFFFFVVVFLSL